MDRYLVPTTFRQLQYLIAVQNKNSIATAARDMSISQSSILAAIDLAEEEFGARIFDRQKGRGVLPTAAGERYLSSARQLLSAEQEFRRNTRGGGRMLNSLRIGCFESFGPVIIVDIVRRLRERLGAFEVTMMEADQVSLKRALDRAELDVAVIYDLGPDFDCPLEHIGRAPPHAMVNAGSPLAAFSEVSINDIAREPIALLNLPLTSSYLMTLFDHAECKPVIGFRSGHYETIIRAVASGFGATVLNIWPAVPLPSELNTKRIRLRETLPAPSIVTADHYGNQKPHLVAAFIDELKVQVALGNRHQGIAG